VNTLNVRIFVLLSKTVVAHELLAEVMGENWHAIGIFLLEYGA
jgi:hypothetical protein